MLIVVVVCIYSRNVIYGGIHSIEFEAMGES